MATLFLWLFRLALLAALLAATLAVGLYWFATRSVPSYEETLVVPRLGAPVEIVRDNANVPHIFGQSDRDVYFGLGLAHAQDRMWQMLMLRRAVQGRLSELFGERTVATDDLLRRLDLYSAAVQSEEVQDAYATEALQAYADGVNAWLVEVNEGARGRGAPEFWIFEPVIAPWQPADSIAIGKLMALRLSTHLADEVLRARVALALSPERLADILPDVPGPGLAALPDYAALFPGIDRRVAAAWPPTPRPDFWPAPDRGMGGASNAWAAAPDRSAAGGTLLANDPHLGFSAPTIWYLARLELATGGVIGATIPGMPTVLLGRSDQLGWALTASYLDDQDLFIERLNPDNSEEVMTPEGWTRVTSRPSIIQIAGQAPITITLRWSENGPILPPRHFDLGAVTPPGHVAALGWTALSPNDTSMSAALALMRAGTVTEALAAGEGIIAPSQNLTVADGRRIAMKVVGANPRRDPRHQSLGRVPAPGWRVENRWQGRMPYSSNPEFINPPGGILGNTNNKTVDRPFPDHLSFTWGDSQRVLRWEFLMQNREVHTRESFIEAQLDTVSFTARSLLPLIAADLWFTEDPAPDGTPERQRQTALALLAEWNGEMNEHLPEPLIYAAWMRALQDRLIRDELGPVLAAEFTHVEPLFLERVFRDVDGASVWCDVIQSAAVETCTDTARQALDEALIWIAENHGSQLESLRWGDAHQARHDHEVLGELPLLRWLVNIRQSTSGGDQTLMRGLTSGTDPEPFVNVSGAGYRGVYDFADPDSSVFITSTGQSGHPFSRHYDDLGELWRRGEYIPMTLDPELARAGAAGITMLEPAP
jgi:penicillin amidase